MKCDSWTSLLPCTFTNPCLGCEPKAKVATLGMVATPIEDSQEVLFNQPPVSQILVGNIYVDHLLVDLHVNPHVDGLPIGSIHVG
jgi:hypothetical protein